LNLFFQNEPSSSPVPFEGSLAPSPDIEFAFSVLFAAPLALALALGKNNANMLLKIKFQQGNFVAKLEFN
jgi:hypothetical protein